MNTKRVCEKIGVTPKALRIYEEHEFIKPDRLENGYRDYSDEDVIKIREVMMLKDMGFSLSEIKSILEKNKYEGNEFVHSLYFQMKAIENRINELKNLKFTIHENINDMVNSKGNNLYEYLDKINKSLEENKESRRQWMDKWSFDSWAKNYDRSVKNTNDGLSLFENYNGVMDSVRNCIGDYRNLKILDIGCGTGNLLGEISKEAEVVGIDQSIEMILIAKEKYPEMNLRLGNFLDKPFCENYFDRIVSTYAFHHLTSTEKEKAIDYMCEYLNENGKIIIGDLMFLNNDEREKCKNKFIKDGRADLWEIVEDEYYGDVYELKSYCEKKGLGFKFKHIVNFTWIIEIEK